MCCCLHLHLPRTNKLEICKYSRAILESFSEYPRNIVKYHYITQASFDSFSDFQKQSTLEHLRSIIASHLHNFTLNKYICNLGIFFGRENMGVYCVFRVFRICQEKKGCEILEICKCLKCLKWKRDEIPFTFV